MISVRVFDPAMCCSTGVCGPSVDPELARFAADLDWLKTHGVKVERFNLAQQPAAFVDAAPVRSTLDAKGEAGLPVILINGEVRSSGVYPSRDELAAWTGVDDKASSLHAAESAPVAGASDCCGPSPDAKPKTGCCC